MRARVTDEKLNNAHLGSLFRVISRAYLDRLARRGLHSWREVALRSLVLEIPHGGLGDHLFWTPIPRLAKSSGKYNRVFISTQSEFRSGSYKDLIWGCNPFVDGFVDAKGLLLGDMSCDGTCNLLDRMLRHFGVDDGQPFHEPEIHFAVSSREDVSGSNVYDPNYVSNAGDGLSSADVASHLSAEGFHPDVQLPPRPGAKRLALDGVPVTKDCSSLLDYAGLIRGCRSFACLATGSATLAAALGKGSLVIASPAVETRFLHSKLHKYIPYREGLR